MHTHGTSGGACHWRVVAASVGGTGHQKAGKACQDVQHWSVAPGGVLVATVADGASSAALGEVGATIAAWIAAATVSPHQHRTRWPDGVEKYLRVLSGMLFLPTAQEIFLGFIRGAQPHVIPVTLVGTVLGIVWGRVESKSFSK